MTQLISTEQIEHSILFIRGNKVMLDYNLATLYGVTTKRLNEQVRRNLKRFPPDFMFQLNNQELKILRSQFATSSWGGRRTNSLAFTEHGVAMLSSILNSDRAIEVNIAIMRTFTKLRGWLANNKELSQKLETLEKKYDTQFKVVFDAIRKLMEPPCSPTKQKIGFIT